MAISLTPLLPLNNSVHLDCLDSAAIFNDASISARKHESVIGSRQYQCDEHIDFTKVRLALVCRIITLDVSVDSAKCFFRLLVLAMQSIPP